MHNYNKNAPVVVHCAGECPFLPLLSSFQFYIKYFFTLPVSHLLTSTHSHHHNPSKYSWTISYVGNAIADTGNARTNMTDKPR